MQIELSNADTTVQLPQSLDSVSLQAPGPLRIEDDGAGVLPAATTLDAGTGLSATDQGDGIVRLDAADVPGSNTQVIFNDNGDLGANAGLTYDGTLTVQGDGTLLDLQDSDGDSVTVSSGATSFRGQKGVIITTEGSGAHPGRIPIDTGGKKPIFTELARFPSGINTSTINSFGQGPILIDSNNGVEWIQDNNVTATLNEDGYFGVGTNSPTATITAQATSGQTDPLLQLNDETGSALIQDTVSGDREYKTPGKGVILTSPDGNATSKVTATDEGGLHVEGPVVGKTAFVYIDSAATATYTLSESDAGKVLHVDTDANNVTVQLPSGLASAGEVQVTNVGAGNVVLRANDGATLYAPAPPIIKAQYGSATIRHNASGSWYAEGRLEEFLLDQYSGARAAYSLRTLRPDYSGPVVRVRRASDNAEQDFTASQVGDGTLAGFLSGANAFVTTFYDQSGNGRDATQAVASDQPQMRQDANGRWYVDMQEPGERLAVSGFQPTGYVEAYSLPSVGGAVIPTQNANGDYEVKRSFESWVMYYPDTVRESLAARLQTEAMAYADGTITSLESHFDDQSIRLAGSAGIDGWDTSQVTNMIRMFRRTSVSDLSPLSGWDTSQVTNMRRMFERTPTDSVSTGEMLAGWIDGTPNAASDLQTGVGLGIPNADYAQMDTGGQDAVDTLCSQQGWTIDVQSAPADC